jgi:hypothetical protein
MGVEDTIHVDIEKGVRGEDSSATLTATHEPPHHHTSDFILHAGHKIRHFLHPDGRKIHIAQHPEQEQSLRRHLSVIHPESDFDIVVCFLMSAWMEMANKYTESLLLSPSQERCKIFPAHSFVAFEQLDIQTI